MTIRYQTKSMDVERLIIVPIFTCLILFDILVALYYVKSISFQLIPILISLQKLLVVAFSILMVALFINRKPARGKDESIVPNVMAYVGTFLPLLLMISKGEMNLIPLSFSLLLMIGGYIFCIYSLSILGYNFSFRPEARSLVRIGPYRFIRHPLYVGELLVIGGCILVAFSTVRLAVFIVLCCIQIYRAFQEEKVLEQNVIGYIHYETKTKRFIPGVV